MNVDLKPVRLLIAEDDDDDFFLLKEALEHAKLDSILERVKDGEELMELLFAQDQGKIDGGAPSLILLDLNMPKKGGREALQEIKAHPRLKKIPVVVFTTSNSSDDVRLTYELGVNSFLQKPLRFEDMVSLLKVIHSYWFEMVKLPSDE